MLVCLNSEQHKQYLHINIHLQFLFWLGYLFICKELIPVWCWISHPINSTKLCNIFVIFYTFQSTIMIFNLQFMQLFVKFLSSSSLCEATDKKNFNYTNRFQYIDLITSNLAEFSYSDDLSVHCFFVSYTGSHICKEFQFFSSL